ncbi:hypothetical protein QTG54_004749 [Skeletonema marinoi]|uniref:Uncharacterized protein n=1 Tax=Skeletonema marinoi TaxID=267567 RepID=A0AAD8YD12_9STRA|nr:hypothetical protein QTG54_004749 [Skeletonema marinoi]
MFHSTGQCRIKVVAVITDDDDDEKAECIINLRSEEEDDDLAQFLEHDFDPQKIDYFDVIELETCKAIDLKKELVEIQGDQVLTDSDVKVVFVAISETDFLDGTCQEELDKLQYTLEGLRCSDIEEFEDFITIAVDSSNECKANEMKEAVLEENAQLKE